MSMLDSAQKSAIITRAQADAAFQARLVADPRAAVAEATGVQLPPDLELVVIQETAARVALVLPAQAGARELSEADLAALSGGYSGQVSPDDEAFEAYWRTHTLPCPE